MSICVVSDCSTVHQACMCCHAGAANGLSKKQKSASRRGSAIPEDIAAGNGHSTTLVLHRSAAQPVSPARADRAGAHSPAPHAGNTLAVVPDGSRQATILRETAEVAEILPNWVIEAQG